MRPGTLTTTDAEDDIDEEVGPDAESQGYGCGIVD